MGKKDRTSPNETSSKETEAIKIEAIKMKGGGDTSIPGLGNFKDGEIRLVSEEVSIKDAEKLVERDVASSVKRPEPDKEVAATKDEAAEAPTKGEVTDNGEE